MELKRTLETQRLRLLRFVAGLLVLIGFLALGPISRGFSARLCGYVGSLLSQVDAAARCLVVAQACLIASRRGMTLDRGRLAAFAAGRMVEDADISPAECRRRLVALCRVLLDLPRHALRLLHRIEKQARRTGRVRSWPCPTRAAPANPRAWRHAAPRIERPPDKLALAT